ncbi:MAG TPA: DUF167 domain-containing protein [Candidatus Paceibacterota bacterium]|nr:DUF167 domain-containing protein [Candidatus Paceibacterota bacterium]
MKIFVKVKPNAKEERVLKIDDAHFSVAVKEPAKEGRANWAVERTLAKYFNVPISCVQIVSGHASRTKVVEIHT